jgi:hypothetical protein
MKFHLFVYFVIFVVWHEIDFAQISPVGKDGRARTSPVPA